MANLKGPGESVLKSKSKLQYFLANMNPQNTNISVPFFYVQIGKIRQNQELSALRDWLLPMLMNGQVRVGSSYEEREEEVNMAAEPFET